MDYNNPKVRWAHQVADLTGEDQAILTNMFGSYDIKPVRAVVVINNPNLMMIIEPKVRRDRNREQLLDCVL